MNKMKWILLGAGVLVLVTALVLTLAFCGKPGNAPVSTEPSAGPSTDYGVQVVNEEGQPLEGVGIYIYQDQTLAELAWFDKTDAQGNMSFTAAARDTYVAVLGDVPVGYAVEEFYALTGANTQIVLKVGVMTEDDMANLKYKLGDKVLDFTLVDTDGNSYTLYDLLKTKKAVVLNFWYTSCEPCKMEFPYLSEAYSHYSDQLELLAINPVDTDADAVAQFKKDNSLPCPVIVADPIWASIMQISGYPTTVIIDRYGNISLIHKGAIESTNTFEQIFEYFVADDYEPTAIKSIEEIVEEQPMGTKDNPFETGAFDSFDVKVLAGQTFYIRLYKQVEAYYLSVEGKNCVGDFTLELQGKTYQDENGERTVYVTPVGAFVALEVQITNNSKQTQTYTFRRSSPKGSYSNPYKLKLGEFDAKVPYGSEEGIYYTYVAEEDGALTITCLKSSVGNRFGMILYNLSSYAMENWDNEIGETDEDGNPVLSVNVKKGQKIQFVISTEPNDSNQYPSGTFKLKASLGDAEEKITIEDLPKTTYTITVVDQLKAPVPEVSIGFTGSFTYVVRPEEEPSKTDAATVDAPAEEETQPAEEETTPPEEEIDPDWPAFDIKVEEKLTTNEKGVATTEQISGPYTATLRVPDGYRLETPQFELTAETPSVTVNMHRIIMKDYTVTLKYPDGKPVVGVSMMLGNELKTTDDQGKAVFNKEEGQYSVTFISGTLPDGYVLPENKTTVAFPQGKNLLALTLVGVGGLENPYQIEKFPFTTKSLAAGEKIYASIAAQVHYDTSPVLKVSDADAVIAYNGAEYKANADGVVEIPLVEAASPLLAISQKGSQAKTLKLEVYYPLGSQYNPIPVTDLKSISVTLEADDQDGIYYKYTPEYAGALTLKVTGVDPADAQHTVWLTTVFNGQLTMKEGSVKGYIESMEDALICVKAQGAAALTLSGSFAIDPTAIDKGKGVYKLTVTDYSGNPIPNAFVIFKVDGSDDPIHEAITDASGKIEDVLLDKAVYKLDIADLGGKTYYYDTVAATYQTGVTQLTVKLTDKKMTDEYEHYGEQKAFLEEGSTYITGLQPVGGETTTKFFLFKPTKPGTYWISTSSAGVIPSYWSLTFNIREISSAYDAQTNRVMLELNSAAQVEYTPFVLGFHGTPADAVVTITYEDKLAWSVEDEPYQTDWLTDYQISKFTLPAGVTYSDLTYVNITDATKNYTAVLNPNDRLYHLNSEDGPVLYVNFGTNAPYMCINEKMHGDGSFGGNGLKKTFLKDPTQPLSEENFLKRETYTERMDEYILASDPGYVPKPDLPKDWCYNYENLIYPLTEEIAYAIQNGCAEVWEDEQNQLNAVFAKAVPGRQWMFAVCYYDDGTVNLSYPVDAAVLEETEALPPEEEETLPPVQEEPEETLPDPTDPTEPPAQEEPTQEDPTDPEPTQA